MLSLSDKIIDKILDISRGMPINRDPVALVMDAIERITNKYFSEDCSPRELAQLSNYCQTKFGYLTVSEIEYAFELCIINVLPQDYKPKSLTFQYLHNVIQAYASASYPIKFKPKEGEQQNTPKLKYDAIITFCLFYKMMPNDSGRDFPLVVDYLIETKEISKPDNWEADNGHNYLQREAAATEVLKWWIDLKHPKALIFDSEKAPYNKGIIPKPVNLGLTAARLKEAIGV